ncbi:hypothetical protein ASC58_12215 [Phycicoccus sp. Root101]|nr:hypothetical protein ASC58_12215 [Phycicoccus sp. Root101]
MDGLFDCIVVVSCWVPCGGTGPLHLFEAMAKFLELMDGAFVARVLSSLDLFVNGLLQLIPRDLVA